MNYRKTDPETTGYTTFLYRGMLLAALALSACGDNQADDPDAAASDAAPIDAAIDLTEAVFDPEHVLQIDVTLDPADWDQLRNQGRGLDALAGDCQAGPAPRPYTFFPGEVTIDGESMSQVGVRKKGFLGSLLVGRPSLKLDFGEYVPGQEYRGMKRMTLNNNRQDDAQIRQCMAYRVFRDVGAPAPRCNFARVTVNGEDLGVYTHVEAIKKPFLRRHFADDSGNLYEGQLSDFRAGFINTMESKTNELTNDRSDLDAAVAALEAQDEDLVAAVSQIFDLDGFLRFWATETLIGHWDGYSNNVNNYYLYHDPTSDRFHFIPWGADLSFVTPDPFARGPRPESVSAAGFLANRLYAIPEIRAQYVATMNDLFDQVWDETALVAEVDRMETLLQGAANPNALDDIRSFIEGRRALFQPELDAGGGEWLAPLIQDPCWIDGGAISGTFATTWGTLEAPDPFAEGTGTLNMEIGGAPVVFTAVASVAGQSGFIGAPQPTVQLVGVQPGGELLVALLYIEDFQYQRLDTIPLHGFATVGWVLDPVTFLPIGFMSLGEIVFDQSSAVPGEPVSGSFTARLFNFPPQGP